LSDINLQNIIECKNITHHFGKKHIYKDLNLSAKKGKVTGLLGKNGVGKSTLINIIMGNLAPSFGECLIFGKSVFELNNAEKADIALLYEGHVSYDFLTILQIERYYAKFYGSRWRAELYYELIDKMGASYNQKISTLSCGQRSQVALGLIFAQDPQILILDDYSMGLDAGYRRLFVDYLGEFVSNKDKSVFLTTHIVADLENLIDDVVILRRDKPPYMDTLSNFRANLKGYEIDLKYADNLSSLNLTSIVKYKDKMQIFGFANDIEHIQSEKYQMKELNLSFEEAFLGLVGRY